MGSILAAIANGAVVSGALTAVVWLALRLAPRRRLNAATRYAFWWATLAATLALPLVYLRTPLHEHTMPGAVRAPSSVERTPTGEASLDRNLRAAGITDEPVKQAARGASFRFPVAPLRVRRPEWIGIAWLAVSLFLIARLMMSWVLLERRRARAFRAPASFGARAERWLARCRSTRTGVLVASSNEVAIPIAVGPRRPSILIPTRLVEELADDELGQIVLHEAAHLARRDDYALLAERLIESLFAFHPVVRWITRQIDLEREVACDDFVVEATGQPRLYASCLTRVVELCGGVRTSLAGASAAGDRSHLARRVDRLLDKSRYTGTCLLKTRLAVMVALLLAAAWTLGRTPALLAFAMPQSPAPQTAPQPAPAVSVTPPASPVPVPSPVIETPAPLPVAVEDPPAPQPEPAPQSASPVVVPVTVTDPSGRYVTGLKAENFKLFDEGVEQAITLTTTDDTPLSVGIVVDASGSIRDRMDVIRRNVADLLVSAHPNDEFFLMPFDNEPVLAVPFTADTQAVMAAMQTLPARGGTALRDSVHFALYEMRKARNQRRALVILTDGEDNSSTRSASDLRRELEESDTLIYNIDISANPAGHTAEWAARQKNMFGPGVNFRHSTAGLALGFRNRYILSFTPSNAVGDTTYHKLTVQLVPPAGLPPLTVMARAGYYTGQ
jgi:Ca-activated chloride channel family protein